MAVDAVAATGSLRTIGTGAAQACAGNDGRLSDARTPTAHATSHQPGGGDAMAVDAVAGTGSLRTLGTGAATACAGNDARLSDARTPTAHSHGSGDLPSTIAYEDAANTWTAGAQDMGGAASFEVPNAAGGTTLDAAGEACVDTTSRTLNIHDGTAEVVLNPLLSKSFLLPSPVATDDLPLHRFEAASTLVKVVYAISGGTNWIGQLREADDAQGTGVADTQTVDSTVTSTTTVTSFSNASFDAGDYIRLGTTSVSGSVTWLHVTFYYRENP